MKYQIFLAEDWVDVKEGEIVHSPWDTKALRYELFDGSIGYTLHWKAVENAVKPEETGFGRRLKAWQQSLRERLKISA